MTDPATTADPSATAGSTPTVDLQWALSQMTGLVLSRETVDTALQLVTTLAATTMPGTSGAAVTIVDEHGARSLAVSNETAERADALQYEFDEGPCLTALRTQQIVRVDDTTTDTRWPRWNRAAADLGIRSVLSSPLLAGDEPAGAMKVYSDRPSNYGSAAEKIMGLLAAQAAILLANTQTLQQARRLSRRLIEAVNSRDTIAAATGVLLARGAASRQDAFLALAAAARESGQLVEDVARALLVALTAHHADG